MKKIVFPILILTLALTAACGPVSPQIESENATLEAELQVMVPVVATEAAALPQTVVEAAGQAALDSSMTTADIAWTSILDQIPCRDQREITNPADLFYDEWGLVDTIQCGPPTPEEGRDEFVYDLSMVGVATLASPAFPADDFLFVIKAGKSLLVVVGVTASAYLAGEGAMWLSRRHTHKNHNPNIEGSTARANISAILAIWSILLTQGPENGPKCGAIKDGAGAVQTLVVWISEVFRPSGGYVAVLRPGNPHTPWLTSYDRSYEGFQKGPRQDKLPEGFVWDANIPCPDTLPGLQTATP